MKYQIQPETMRLYAITCDGAAMSPKYRLRVRRWLQAGARTIQLREKRLPADEVLEFGRFLRAITAEYNAMFIVNDNPGLAAMLEADGCHLGWDDMPVDQAREILGPDAIIGISTHTREQTIEASKMDVDYVAVGPIYKSRSKDPGYDPLGADYAGWATRTLSLPVVAIGGINLGNIGRLASSGCQNAAVIAAINKTARPSQVVRAFIEILEAADSTSLR